jgi:murein DD-endopeptidase MepM/ murein hydrolase activator NlpD
VVHLAQEATVKGLILLINILLKTKKVIFWLFNKILRLSGWLLVYRPLVWLYRGYLRFKRRLINRYQQNLWLTAVILLALAVMIAVNNWRESGRLVAAEDLVRGTWLSRLVGDEFNQLNDLVVDDQAIYQLNLNHSYNVTSKLATLIDSAPVSAGFVGMATDRWVYGLGLASLPLASDQPTAGLSAGQKEITYYTVRIGDTLSGIARDFGVTINTIAWQNGLSLKALLRPGDKLVILPVSGVLHKVKAGDSLSKIANQYEVEATAIIAYNKLSGDRVIIGQSLVIPGGQPSATMVSQVAKAVADSNLAPKVQQVFSNVKKTVTTKLGASGSMTWPTIGHRITQYYSLRHTGVDIGNKVGTPIYAADNGKVELAATGWNGGYGNTIVLNHGKLKTRYGHLSRLYVRTGQTVVKGQAIGEMGSTGRSTGSHLHFEVLSGKVRYNPLNYIR